MMLGLFLDLFLSYVTLILSGKVTKLLIVWLDIMLIFQISVDEGCSTVTFFVLQANIDNLT